jgi:Tol biopolymer transport system component
MVVVMSVALAGPVLASTERVSQSSSGAAISADGRYVAFSSDAGYHVPGDANGRSDIFVRDRDSGTIERISVSPDGVQANDFS